MVYSSLKENVTFMETRYNLIEKAIFYKLHSDNNIKWFFIAIKEKNLKDSYRYRYI